MGAQPRGKVPVQLDHGQVAQTLDQRLRQGRQARTDLHHRLTSPGINRLHDRVDDAAIGQEVLAEALAGDVLHCGGSRYST